MHEDGAAPTVGGRLVELACEPSVLLRTYAEVRSPAAGAADIEKQAAYPAGLYRVRETLGIERMIEIVEAARLHVVIAGDDMHRHRQAGEFTAGKCVLLRQPVIRVVAREVDEVERAGEFVQLIDDRREVAVVLFTLGRQVQIAYMGIHKQVVVVDHRVSVIFCRWV